MTETVTQERRNEIADGLESMAETLGLAKGHQAILRNASRALRQSDTRIEGDGWREFRPEEDLPPTGQVEVRWRDADIASSRTAINDAAAIGWQYVSWWRPAAPPSSPVNKSPTPEHVEGDVLSVGEMEVVGYGVRKIGEAVFQPFLNKPDAGPEYEVEPLVLLTSATTRIQRADRERVYECAGCGRLTNNPTRDLEDIQSRGGKSCCPERNVKLLTPAEIISRIGQLADAVKVLNGMLAIVGDSRGVDGYHRNGDVAEWDEFPEIEDARTFLSTIGEKQE